MKKRQVKTRSILGTLLIKLAIIAMVLLVASYLKLRLDFSANKAYSLSKVSKQAVHSLKDNMVVKVFASDELPTELSTLDRYMKDLLAEYQIASKGKFHYEFIRGLSMDELRFQAQENGLSSMYFQIYENDKTTSKEVVFGLVFEYQGKFDSMNLMPQMETKLEYEITQKIQKLSQYTLPEVSVFRDSMMVQMPTKRFNEALSNNFKVIETDLLNPPMQTPAMIFTGVIGNLSDKQLYNLDQYIMKGGRLVFLQDRVSTDGNSLFVLDSNIFPFLEHYGIRIDRNIAMDIFCDLRSIGVDNTMPFPIYPVLRGSQHPITRNLADIVMYMANGLSSAKKPEQKFISILQTSNSSAMVMAPEYRLDQSLFENPDPDVFNLPPITLGAIVEGAAESYFNNRPDLQSADHKSRTDDYKMVVYGDRDLVIDADKSIYADRVYIVLNAVDWLLGRDSMISIRARHLQRSILDITYFMHKNDIVWGDPVRIERRIKTGIKLVSTVLPSLILLIIGGFIALHRKQLHGVDNEED
jgi:gliding-associated putative ABC transporter substrate-binding component GldG